MSDDTKISNLAQIIAEMNKFTLPKRPDKVPLTEDQKYIIKHWIRPSGTFSQQCDYCGQMYSAGFLKVCPKQPEIFCGRKPVEYVAPKPTGYTDEELGFYFGIDREELDK